jgi:hypothetical protein
MLDRAVPNLCIRLEANPLKRTAFMTALFLNPFVWKGGNNEKRTIA